MSRVILLLFINLLNEALSDHNGSDLNPLIKVSSFIQRAVPIPVSGDLCQLYEGQYRYKSLTRFSISKAEGCRLNGLWQCDRLTLNSEDSTLKCGNTDLSIFGLLKSDSTKQDMEPLKFSWDSSDLCKVAYQKGISSFRAMILDNEIEIKTTASTQTFSRECEVHGDFAQSHELPCASVFLTPQGAVCKTGARLELLRYSRNVSNANWLRAIGNQYGLKDHKLILRCQKENIELTWLNLGSGENYQEALRRNTWGNVTDVIETTDHAQKLYHLEAGDAYKVINMKNLVEAPKTVHASSEYYKPSYFKAKKGGLYPSVNYLNAVTSCCNEDSCQVSFRSPDKSTSRTPASQESSGDRKTVPGMAAN